MRVQIFLKPTEILIKEWEKLWENSLYANVVNSPAWFLYACKAFSYKEKLIVALYADNDSLVGVGGFVKNNLYGISVYTVPALEFADKNPLLIDFKNKNYIKIFFKEIDKLGTVCISALSRDEVKLIDSTCIFIDSICPFIELSGGTYVDLSKHKKKKLFKRLEKLPEKITFKNYNGTDLEALEIAYSIELESSKIKSGKKVFSKSSNRVFYSELAQKVPYNTIVSLLFFGQKPVAYTIGFLCNGIFTSSQKAHLDCYSYYNPGRVLKYYLIDYLNKMGIAEFNFGRGADYFKMSFTNTTRELYSIVVSRKKIIKSYILVAYRIREFLYNIVSKYKSIYVFYGAIKSKLLV